MARSEQGDLEVRQAQLDDVGALVELGMEIHQLHAEGRPDVFREPEPTAMREFFESQFTLGRHTLIAVARQQPVGYLLAELLRREGDALRHEASIFYIHHIAVAASARGTGVGKALINAGAEVARRVGAGRLRLDAWQFNTRAHQFFTGQGFVPANVIFERTIQAEGSP